MKSQLVLQVSALTRSIARGNRALVLAAALGASAMVAAPVYAQATKIGFVSTERILRDSKPAKAAQAKIEAELKRRDDESPIYSASAVSSRKTSIAVAMKSFPASSKKLTQPSKKSLSSKITT